MRRRANIAIAQGAISFAISLYDAPMSYRMNGKQHAAVAADDTVCDFGLCRRLIDYFKYPRMPRVFVCKM
jgi:hypothetical protein